MKWLVLQLLTLYCLVIMPVTGGIGENPEPVTKRPDFILVYPKLRECSRNPTYYECHRKCKYSWNCALGYECCFSVCGTICLNIRQIETFIENTSPSTEAETTLYPTTTTESWDTDIN
ncbi:WAP four-disulfide core domain protein 10A-like [Eumetopias jubatus]|uniref:WAP four-disulfide core domain protein 10A-like n=1 Tax=Callorhinus ursinus TaxID=34884 RepID=A0A3Q7PC26_CALUR|nr:WAP four-disulfide core domain protein 10A-like [Callorhinus ursinus]XP_025731319.1 WAP four-disulfide core domain protein 10A-like [Callorhinus ursinus]XP_027977734.1 WAP four-disulfide core domain protein 10A-like [Eumetopias jubatus]